jgi:hypothetical protein
MLNALDDLWGLGVLFGALMVFGGYCTANVEKPDMEEAYRHARNGGIIIFVSAILMWVLRVQHYWPSLHISN